MPRAAGLREISPVSYAKTTACALLFRVSLLMQRWTCVLMVAVLSTSRWAMSELDMPAPTSPRTSNSLGVRVSSAECGSDAAGRGCRSR